MEKFKEFQGSDLDDCIRQAVSWFDTSREMLEIEIIQNAKSGIFGIVGARKAKIRAKKAQVVETMRDILGNDGEKKPQAEISATAAAPQPPANKNEHPQKPRDGEHKRQPEAGARKKLEQPQSKNRKKPQPPRDNTQPGPVENIHLKDRPDHPGARKKARHMAEEEPAQNRDLLEREDLDSQSWPARPIEELDQDELGKQALDIVRHLIEPIAGCEVGMGFDISAGNPRIRIDWQGDAGLLIGREGQTLASIQYLASRILSKRMRSSLRVRLDIGEYRAKQSERLRDLALNLAGKARHAGRPYSTRPLSSFHRRVIHLALQNMPDIQTKSAGDGPLKRVIISPKRV